MYMGHGVGKEDIIGSKGRNKGEGGNSKKEINSGEDGDSSILDGNGNGDWNGGDGNKKFGGNDNEGRNGEAVEQALLLPCTEVIAILLTYWLGM